MALISRAWIREKATRDWHRTRIRESDGKAVAIATRCGLEDLEWDRAASMPGAGAKICRACLEAEEFAEEVLA